MPPPNPSIFQDGKIKPGVYKIKNIVSQTYVDIKDHLRGLCGRPSIVLENDRGLWEILPLGSGYSIKKAGPTLISRPDQFCIMLEGITNGSPVSVAEFPVAWKIAIVEDPQYANFQYVRIFWGSTNMVWDLAGYGSTQDGTKIQVVDNNGRMQPCRIWELIPVDVEDLPPRSSSYSRNFRTSNDVPPYEERAGTRCCGCSHTSQGPSDDGYGTTVVEVTTLTTRKKYRVEG